jgi:peptide/nickel transport system substrate-binding protein
VSQARFRIGAHITGAFGCRWGPLGDYNEDPHHQEGDEQEAARILHYLRRRAADEQEVTVAVSQRDRSRRSFAPAIAVSLLALGATALSSCGSIHDRHGRSGSATTLRIGSGQLPDSSSSGASQLARILTIENLARAGEDGRMQPWLAQSWVLSQDGRSLKVNLRSGVKFTDGTPLDAALVARVLPEGVRAQFGPIFEDVEGIEALTGSTVEIRFRRRSMFHLEALEAPITKPEDSGIGTGAFSTVPNSTSEFRANPDYYLGKPEIDRVSVTFFPSVRAAWAEALRGNLDALYEVGSDAFDSLERSTTISTYVFNRRYQHVIALNPHVPALRSTAVRRLLNSAIDRKAFVQSALNGHGIESSGPLWPQFWAAPPIEPRDIPSAESGGKSKIVFKCLVISRDTDERIALEVKKQLAAQGIDMIVESVSQQAAHQRMNVGDYEAALLELVSGPTLLRPYIVWLSTSPLNPGHFGNATVDAALERARKAETEDDFRKAVADVQQAFRNDPPAIFLAWNQRARAVSNRFIVPPPEPGRDILSTLRMWKPADSITQTNRN